MTRLDQNDDFFNEDEEEDLGILVQSQQISRDIPEIQKRIIANNLSQDIKF